MCYIFFLSLIDTAIYMILTYKIEIIQYIYTFILL